MDIWKKCMAIWLPDYPDIQISQGLHRLPMNTTYWTGWPTQENPYVNPAHFHLTWPLVVHTTRAGRSARSSPSLRQALLPVFESERRERRPSPGSTGERVAGERFIRRSTQCHSATSSKRLGMFLLIVWLAATVNFFLPRLGGGDPVRAAADAAGGAGRQHPDRPGGHDRRSTTRSSGSNKPLWQQYLTYLGDMRRLDFNYSIANYPQTRDRHHRRSAALDPRSC